jgi:hypothetical protein
MYGRQKKGMAEQLSTNTNSTTVGRTLADKKQEESSAFLRGSDHERLVKFSHWDAAKEFFSMLLNQHAGQFLLALCTCIIYSLAVDRNGDLIAFTFGTILIAVRFGVYLRFPGPYHFVDWIWETFICVMLEQCCIKRKYIASENAEGGKSFWANFSYRAVKKDRFLGWGFHWLCCLLIPLTAYSVGPNLGVYVARLLNNNSVGNPPFIGLPYKSSAIVGYELITPNASHPLVNYTQPIYFNSSFAAFPSMEWGSHAWDNEGLVIGYLFVFAFLLGCVTSLLNMGNGMLDDVKDRVSSSFVNLYRVDEVEKQAAETILKNKAAVVGDHLHIGTMQRDRPWMSRRYQMRVLVLAICETVLDMLVYTQVRSPNNFVLRFAIVNFTTETRSGFFFMTAYAEFLGMFAGRLVIYMFYFLTSLCERTVKVPIEHPVVIGLLAAKRVVPGHKNTDGTETPPVINVVTDNYNVELTKRSALPVGSSSSHSHAIMP